jgi:hypothetical protein
MGELLEKMSAAGFRVIHARHHNTLGAIGWWMNGKILRKKVLEEGQVKGFKLLRPFLKLDERFESRFSLSILAIGEKAN